MDRARIRIATFAGMAALLVCGQLAAADAPGHKDHPPVKALYDAAYHDADGKHQHRTFDMSKPEDAKELEELIAHGHVVAMENATPPTPSKLFSLRADLGIWSLVIFGLLFFVLSRMAWPKMLAGLQKRESNIHSALHEAKQAREEATTLRAEYQKEIDGAHLKVKEILDEARRDATTATDEMIAKARTEIQTERDRANRDISVATDQALQTIWAKAADLATEVSAAALGKQLDTTMHRRLIDESLNDLRAASKN